MGKRGMTAVYLIRHAEAEGNLYRIAHGQYDGLITQRGYEQIKALEKRFEGVEIDAVYSSDLFRARTTAKALYVPRGLTLHTDPSFREIHMGRWEGRTWQEIGAADPVEMEHFNLHLDKFSIEGGETAQQVLDRYIPALHRVVAAHDGQTVAIFSHGAALRIVLSVLSGLSLASVGQTPHGDNTAVSLLEVEGGEIRVVYMNDNSHLVAAGLSTFAKQSWWKDKRLMEGGESYRPLTVAEAQTMGVPAGGIPLAVCFQDELIGAMVMEPDKSEDYGFISWYYIKPAYRGRHLGIPPLGQAVQYYRLRGIERLRLVCEDEAFRGFFTRYGFYPVEDGMMEKYIGYEEKVCEERNSCR